MIAFSRNERLEIDGVVCAVDRRTNTGFQMVGIGDGAIRVFTENDLVQGLFDGRMRHLRAGVADDEVRRANPLDRDFTSYSPQSQAEMLRRKRYLDAIRERFGPPPYSDNAIEAAVPELRALADDVDGPVSRASLRRWLARERRASDDIRILTPERDSQGARGEVFHKDIEATIIRTIDTYILCQAPLSVASIYATLVTNIKQDPALAELGQIPSQPTLYRRVAAVDAEERIIRQDGRRAARIAFPPGKAGPIENEPLGIVEIDHKLIDGQFVRDGVLVGRAWLTAAIDRATRACLGFVITWESPSYVSIMLLLRHMIRPKHYVATMFADTVRNSWPCYGIPKVIVVDNGPEFHSTHFENACRQLGIQIIYAERKTPQHKGRIERFFRTLNQGLFHGLPGTTLSNFSKAVDSDYDPEKHAWLTIEKVSEFLHKFIIDIYMQRLHRGLKEIPIAAWEDRVEAHPVRLPRSLQDLDILIAGTDTRTLRPTGIEIFSLFYQSDELREMRIRHGSVSVQVRYDPADLGWVWVANPDSGRHIKVPCQNPKIAMGLTQWQRKRILEQLGEKARGANEKIVLQAMAELRADIDGASRKSMSRATTRRSHARMAERPVTPDHLGATAAMPAPASIDAAFASPQQPAAPKAKQPRKRERPAIEPGMTFPERPRAPILRDDEPFQPSPGFETRKRR